MQDPDGLVSNVQIRGWNTKLTKVDSTPATAKLAISSKEKSALPRQNLTP